MTFSGRFGNVEYASPGEIWSAQDTLFREHVRMLGERSPFYRELFGLRNIHAPKVTLDALRDLPFTDKTMLSERNDEFLAVPMGRIVDVVLSSGTTGRPTTMMYTENDLVRLAYNEEISLAGTGLSRDDVVLLTCTIDRCFIAGLAYFSGVRSLGAAAIRNGLSSFESHYEVMQRLRPTAIIGVPTFLLKLGRYMQSLGADPRAAGVRRMICIGEPLRDRNLAFVKVGESLEEVWGAKVFSTYASSETITSFCECAAQQGGHLHPDLAVVEIVDDQGNALASGETGEVVVTPLAVEGMPLLRFRTGDVSFLIDEPCSCGRRSPRLGPILGRKKQMIKFRGTTLYPNSIFAVLDGMPGIGEYYVTATDDFDLSDAVRVTVALKDASCTAASIAEKLQAHLRVRPEVVIADAEAVNQNVYAGNTRKPRRFIDKRRSA